MQQPASFGAALRCRLLPALAGLALTPLGLGASAARSEQSSSGPAEPDLDEELVVVVTGARTAEQTGRAVVRVDVVGHEEALRRGATNVGEALASQLGVSVNPAAYGSIGQPSAAQIGGFDRERILVLEDGERVVGDVGGAVDLSQFSLAGLARIEVVRGPSSALYGSSAIGGVINMVSAPPEQEGLSGHLQIEGRHRWGGLASGQIVYRAEDSWVSLAASGYGSEGVTLLPPDTAIASSYRTEATLRGGTRLGAATMSARLRYGREAALGVASQQVSGLGTYLIDLPDTTDRFSIALRSELALGERHSVAASLSKQWFDNRTAKDRRDSPIDERRQRKHTMHSAELTGSFFEGAPVSLLLGGRAEVERFEQELERTSSVGDSLSTRPVAEVPAGQVGVVAGYGQLRTDPWPWLSATLGGRAELNASAGASLAPRLALAFFVGAPLTIRVSGGRGFRAPSAKEIGFSFDHSALGYRVLGNPDLAPETSWGVQGDVTVKPLQEISLLVSGYANWVDQLIDLQLAPTQGGASGVDDYRYVNVGKALTSGLDARLSVRALQAIWTEFGYGYAFSRDHELQRPLPGRPPHTLIVGLRAETPIGLRGYLRLRGVTDAYLSDALRSPSFGALDLRIEQDVGAGFAAYAGATNLVGWQKDPTRSGDQRPLEGRTIYLGLRAELPAE